MLKNLSRKSIAIFLVMLMSVAVFAGCGAKPAPGASAKGKVMIYTSIYPDIIELMKPELVKAFPDIEVEFFQGGTESVITKITGEIEAKSIQADLLMVADPSYYLTLQEKGVLEKYDFEERKNTTMKDTEGYWT
ncbi:MAG TPA: hypothetical protein VLN47_04745, partial [Clostridiaceae bacterium]|nr:hypothetical protein [Clostridiaceae bacterium]